MSVTKKYLEDRLDHHYKMANEISLCRFTEHRELTARELANYKHHCAEILVLKNRIWDEFILPEWKAEDQKLQNKQLLEEIRALENEP